jgi:hypothetical protein
VVDRKPSFDDLGIDVNAVPWRRAGEDDQSIEVAFVDAQGERWALLRVAGAAAGLVSVFNRHEWECFLDGAKRGEFDDAVS